jgi:hypothetical protein
MQLSKTYSRRSMGRKLKIPVEGEVIGFTAMRSEGIPAKPSKNYLYNRLLLRQQEARAQIGTCTMVSWTQCTSKSPMKQWKQWTAPHRKQPQPTPVNH